MFLNHNNGSAIAPGMRWTPTYIILSYFQDRPQIEKTSSGFRWQRRKIRLTPKSDQGGSAPPLVERSGVLEGEGTAPTREGGVAHRATERVRRPGFHRTVTDL